LGGILCDGYQKGYLPAKDIKQKEGQASSKSLSKTVCARDKDAR